MLFRIALNINGQWPRNLVFSDISFMAILAGVTPSESDPLSLEKI